MTDLVKKEVRALAKPITGEEIQLARDTIARGLNDTEWGLYMYECKRRGVHPLDRMIFPVKRKLKQKDGNFKEIVAYQTGIDYLRSQSEATGEFAGSEEPYFGPEIDLDDDPYYVKDCPKVPSTCKIVIYRRDKTTGEKFSVTATARWREFYPKGAQGQMWRKMPYHMLAKVAEALARRMAFPQELAGLVLHEEMTSIAPMVSGDGVTDAEFEEIPVVSDAQITKFWTKMSGAGLSNTQVHAWLKEKFNLTSIKDVLARDFDFVLEAALKELKPTPKAEVVEAELYEEGDEAPAPDGHDPATCDCATVPIGKDKGKKLCQLDDGKLDWFIKLYQGKIENPEDAKYKANNERFLSYLNGEKERRG